MDPITAAFLAYFASVALKNRAEKKVVRRQGELTEQENMRQDALRNEARARNATEQAEAERSSQDSERAAAEARAGAALQPTQTVPADVGSYAQTSSSAPTEVNDEIARQFVSALGAARSQAQQQARLRSYGDTQFNNDVRLGRLGQDIGRLGGISEGSTGAYETEMGASRYAGSRERGLSEVAGGAGDIALMYGLTRPNAPRRAPTPRENEYMRIHSGYSR